MPSPTDPENRQYITVPKRTGQDTPCSHAEPGENTVCHRQKEVGEKERAGERDGLRNREKEREKDRNG